MTNWSSFPSTGPRVTTWNYDLYRGWLTNKTYDGGTPGPIYSNTPAGRLALRIWGRGTNTIYGYNNAGQVSSVSYSDGTPAIEYGFDRRGLTTSITNGTSICRKTYDLSGAQLGESWTAGTLAGLLVTNNYDHFLRRTNLAVQQSGTPKIQQSFAYDAASRMKTIVSSTNSFGCSYIANSPLISQIYFTNNGTLRMTTTKQFDFLNRLTSISSAAPGSPPLSSFAYVYNSANQRIRRTEADGSFWIYEYDPLGQVRSGRKYWPDWTPVAGQQFEYSHDDIGNRRSTRTGGDQNGGGLRYAGYSANSLNQYTNRDVPGSADIIGVAIATNAVTVNGQTAYRKREYFWKQFDTNNTNAPVYAQVTVSSAGSNIVGNVFLPKTQETFAYDGDGNLTSDGRWNYFWDAENRLIALAARTSVGLQSSLKFEYDSTARRIRKQVWSNTTWTGSSTNDLRFVYDGWNLLSIVSYQSSILQSFTWGLDLSGSEQGAGGIGGLFAVWDSAALNSQPSTHFCAFDGNGDVALLLNAAGTPAVAGYEYGPFGELLRATGPMASANPFSFSAKYRDNETDLLYYGYRHYNPAVGRWLGRDPIAENGGANLLGFAGNDPVNRIDNFGLVIVCNCELDAYLTANGIGPDMYTKSGNTYSAKQKQNVSPQVTGVTEILFRMLETEHKFVVKDSKLDNLKKHVEARLAIVNNAKAARFSWRDEGTKILNPTGPHRQEILQNPNLYFLNHAAEFFTAVNNEGTKIGCTLASRFVFESGNLHSGTPVRPNDKIFVPGDWPYMDNVAQTRKPFDWAPGLEGENLIYIGGGDFWGHPLGSHTEAWWRSTIRDWKSKHNAPGEPEWGNHTDVGPAVIKYPSVGLEGGSK